MNCNCEWFICDRFIKNLDVNFEYYKEKKVKEVIVKFISFNIELVIIFCILCSLKRKILN